jgi:hypothetical protein
LAVQLKKSYALKIKRALRCFERFLPTPLMKQRKALKMNLCTGIGR